MTTKAEMPAYPPMMQVMADGTFQPIQPVWTKREVFAMAAMQGMGACMKWDGAYSKIDRDHGLPEAGAKWVAIAAVRYADALIAALSDQPTTETP